MYKILSKPAARMAALACVITAQLAVPIHISAQYEVAPFHKATALTPLAQQPFWRTLAGYPGVAGTNDGAGVAARFSRPSGVIVDFAGQLYVADTGNHVIRKINWSDTGTVVSTLAGQPGVSGYRNGSVATALFKNPTGLAWTPQHDWDLTLCVADAGNYVIRKITPEGIVSTFAGQPGTRGYRDGTNALFGTLGPLASDRNGNLYVADEDNYVIRKIDPAGVVSTFAGSGVFGYRDGSGSNALFGAIGGLVVDHNGILYVADSDNRAIRKISPQGDVSTWAGGNGPGSRDGTGTNAWFGFPTGLAFDGLGNLFVADAGNSRIRKITPEGVVSAVSGGTFGDYVDGPAPFARFSSPQAISFGYWGQLVVVDSGNNTVREGLEGQYPQILVQPKDRSSDLGSTITLSVGIQDPNQYSYQWLGNGRPIEGATNTSLVLQNLREQDAGEYRLAIWDRIGYRFSFAASVELLAQPNSPAPLNQWHPVASAPLREIDSLVYGNGRFVAAGVGGLATSDDGQHWLKELPITAETLKGVAFGNGMFVAVGTRASVFTSNDGLEWKAQTLTPEGSPDLSAVVFDQGIFVAVANDENGSIWTSRDGRNWSNQGVDFGLSLQAVVSQGGKFIAAGNTIIVSTNGLDWEPANVPSNHVGDFILLQHIASGNGTILASDYTGWWGGEGILAVSPNGLDWEDATPTNGLVLSQVTWGNGQFLAIDETSGGVCVSSDGIQWSQPAPVGSGERTLTYPDLAFAHGLFVSTGFYHSSDASMFFTSTNGSSWDFQEMGQAVPFVPHTLLSVDGRYYGGGRGSGIEVTTNLSNWELLLPTNSFNDLAYGDGTLVAVAGNDLIFTSQDGGASWRDRSPHLTYGTGVPNLVRIAYGNGILVTAGDVAYPTANPRAYILASNDGASTWVAGPDLGDGFIEDVAYGDGRFAALYHGIDNIGGLLTSTNGLHWTWAIAGPVSLNTIAFGNGRFVVGASGPQTLFTSSDGMNWRGSIVPGVSGFGQITFGNGLFLASGAATDTYREGLWVSSDGITWTECNKPGGSLLSLMAGQGVFLMTDVSGTLYESGPLERLGNPRWLDNSDLEWTVTGAPNLNYSIQFSGDLRNWSTLEQVTNAPGVRPFIDPGAATRPARYYRVLTDQPR